MPKRKCLNEWKQFFLIRIRVRIFLYRNFYLFLLKLVCSFLFLMQKIKFLNKIRYSFGLCVFTGEMILFPWIWTVNCQSRCVFFLVFYFISVYINIKKSSGILFTNENESDFPHKKKKTKKVMKTDFTWFYSAASNRIFALSFEYFPFFYSHSKRNRKRIEDPNKK